MLILFAFLIIIGGWYAFYRNKKKGNSNWILSGIMVLSPVLFLMIGIAYASHLHDQGVGFGSAYLAVLLFFNSLAMLGTNIIGALRKNQA
ncbi:hypothetical protein [Bacillus sp. KH172YL63]|uniref:hypothetical protein n=1 Tax=Bacillus sp. KH172YL63 TaxID=2709784 RepID=UPI0013E45FB4|nr:hypothetical protein [Bacillus sp. KH172YL63]BCB05105.1 hypothetical protein KH172YL63_32380 [Bacillus sp. KH172YL63]